MIRGYLLDTSAVSMLAPGRTDATPEFVAWLRKRNGRLHTSSIVVMEITQGIAKLRRIGNQQKADGLERWLHSHISDFEDRVLHVDVDVARAAGRLADAALAIGKHPGLADILIAGICDVHGLAIVTRNIRHFEPLGIDVIDPLVRLPD